MRLDIYYKDDYKERGCSFDIDNINKAHPHFKNEKYWKIDNDEDLKLNSDELANYGEFILNIIEKYKKRKFYYNLVELFESSRPFDFNMYKIIYDLQYQYCKSLNEYLSNYIKLKKHEYSEFKYNQFYDIINDLNQKLEEYLENPSYEYHDAGDVIDKVLYDEIKKFAYFCMMNGDSCCCAIYVKD